MSLFKVCFYVPEEYAEAVKNAMFKAGAGQIGSYANCCWQVKGEGQFTPLEGSDAFTGKLDQLSRETEYKVEMVCDTAYIQAAIAALKTTHPYETPAYQVFRCEAI